MIFVLLVFSTILMSGCIEKDSYTVTFDTRGFSEEYKNVIVQEGESIDLSNYIPSQEEYRFLGWSSQSDIELMTCSLPIVYVDTEFIPTEDTRLTAISMMYSSVPKVNIEEYSLFYEGDDFQILKRKESAVDNDLVFAMIGIILENSSTDDYCIIGVQTEYMYVIQFDEVIYDLSDAYYLGFYDCSVLLELAIIE